MKEGYRFEDEEFNKVFASGHRLILMTTHRRENLGEPMRHVYRALKSVLEAHPDVEAIFPVHKNPKVREIVREELGHLDRVHLIEPMEYEPFANLMAKVDIVLTDSGGIQEEAPALSKPVLVLRDTTERPEAVEAGTVKLVGTAYDDVLRETNLLLDDAEHYRSMAEAANPYGDALSARIEQLERQLAGGVMPVYQQAPVNAQPAPAVAVQQPIVQEYTSPRSSVPVSARWTKVRPKLPARWDSTPVRRCSKSSSRRRSKTSCLLCATNLFPSSRKPLWHPPSSSAI